MNLRFENDVNLYGYKTVAPETSEYVKFENDVNLYGNKTLMLPHQPGNGFENDINLYGNKVNRISGVTSSCTIYLQGPEEKFYLCIMFLRVRD